MIKQTGFMHRVHALSAEELQQRLNSARQDLCGLRINAVSQPVKDYSQYKKLRKQIAQLLTAIQFKKNGIFSSKQ
jgi:ribosomal protein L29